MDLAWNVALFGFGIFLLVKGSDWLVDASARIAKQFGVSNFIIGLTIVALGTSLPELGAAATASFYGNSDIVLGDIIGSNVANIALIMGIAGLFVPIAVRKDVYLRDGAVMIFATLLLYLFSMDGIITILEGGIFLFFFMTYMHYFFATKEEFRGELHFKRYLDEYANIKKRQKIDAAPVITKSVRKALHEHVLERIGFFARHIKQSLKRAKQVVERAFKSFFERKAAVTFLFKQLGILFLGLACLFFGSNFVVTNAMAFPISQLAVGLIFIAVGTSLPELAVTISSLKKGLPDIMIGNLIGSNIANIFWVGGISALINPIIVPIAVLHLDFIFMILVTWMFLVFLRNDYKFTRVESISMLIFYAIFVAIAFGVRLGL